MKKMKQKMYLIFEGLLFVALAGLIAAFQNNLSVWTTILKTTASLCFVLVAVCGYIQSENNCKFSKTMLAAFLCSMAGDVLLAFDVNQGILFVMGVLSFASAHVLFSVAFCSMSSVTGKDIMGTIAVFICLLLLLLLGDFDFQGLLPVLIGYSAIISFMMVKAFSIKNCQQMGKKASVLLMSGGVLFLLSDIILLFWLFGIGTPKEVQSVNWFFYYLAQGCLAASLSKTWD